MIARCETINKLETATRELQSIIARAHKEQTIHISRNSVTQSLWFAPTITV